MVIGSGNGFYFYWYVIEVNFVLWIFVWFNGVDVDGFCFGRVYVEGYVYLVWELEVGLDVVLYLFWMLVELIMECKVVVVEIGYLLCDIVGIVLVCVFVLYFYCCLVKEVLFDR